MSHKYSGFEVTAVAIAAGALTFLASGCGGGGSGGTVTGPPPPLAANVVSVIVDGGPAGTVGVVNTPYVSVTVCAHGTSSCQTIDHITVDTASTGLRIISSVLSTTVAAALGQVLDAQSNPLVECTNFADGYSWGPVKVADVQIGGEQASSVPIQVIGDPAFSTVPSDCTSLGRQEDTVADFGGNGILGIAVFKEDCGPGCVTKTFSHGPYYDCPPNGGCVVTTATLASQVANPVALFATADHNGTILELPTVGAAGAGTLTGSLIFGIDTESNNALGMATVLTVDSIGDFSTMFNNQTLPNSFIDSGSNAYFFPDGSTTVCTSAVASGFYCPSATQSLTATITSASAISKDVSFTVANADALFNGQPSFTVFGNLAGTNSDPASFDFGLPFFMGRHVYTAIEGETTSAGMGPFVAF